MMTGMSPSRAQGAVEDLIAIAHAVKSGTLEKDTKAFLQAARKAADAEKGLSQAKADMKRREDAASRKEKSNATASARVKADREALKNDQAAWNERKDKEQDDLLADRTRLNVDAAAVKDRDQKARAMMTEAQTMMDAARELEQKAKATQADYESRLAKLREATA